jgi:phage I-like protein
MPADRLGGALEALRGLAVKVTNESQSVQDVTDQAVDVQARLRTLRATEDELIALLREARERGRKVDDVMAIYRELTGIRTQIEQYQGQLQSLQNLAALSTVTVQLAPDAATAPLQAQGWRPMETVKNSLRQLVTALRGVADFAIWAALVLLPIGALVAGLVALLLALVRWVAKRRSAA